jgi:hypothetical protein
MKVTLLILFSVFVSNTYSQVDEKRNFDDILHGLTTIIKVTKTRLGSEIYSRSQGTGFFFQQNKDTQFFEA